MTDTRIALTIAGSDSGGGAGIQADLKTFHQFHVYGTSVIVAVTAQNTHGVTAAHVVPPDLVDAQIDAVMTDLRPHALKTGMLADVPHIERVARQISKHKLPNVVVDPVMVATSGDRLLAKGAEQTLVENLLPLARVVTPNIFEATVLSGRPIKSERDMADAARHIRDLGPRAVLVTGGHLGDNDVCDLLIDDDGERSFVHPRIATDNTHGTGCTLSAAIAASLALGATLDTAVGVATTFVHEAIATAPGLGTGHGPINHFAGVTTK